ncbi:MAG TPA: hypothetical protein VHZ78_01015 [Rhizomicrobium sp.]|jgi:hypothetical protein|nr:hypothetical protein [Rhizomicrobium sp.]
MRYLTVLCLLTALSPAALAASDDAPADPPASDIQPPSTDDALVGELIPPNASSVFHSRDGKTLLIGCVSTLTPQELEAFYYPAMDKIGWRMGSETRTGNAHSYMLAKSPKGDGILILEPTHGQMRVLLSMTE